MKNLPKIIFSSIILINWAFVAAETTPVLGLYIPERPTISILLGNPSPSSGRSRQEDTNEANRLIEKTKSYDRDAENAEENNDWKKQEQIFLEKLKFVLVNFGHQGPHLINTLSSLADFYESHRKPNEEIKYRRELLLLPEQLQNDDAQMSGNLRIAEALENQNQFKAAYPYLIAALNASQSVRKYDKRAVLELAKNLNSQLLFSEAEPYAREANAKYDLVISLEGQGKFPEAETLARQLPDSDIYRQKLISILKKQGKNVEAATIAESDLVKKQINREAENSKPKVDPGEKIAATIAQVRSQGAAQGNKVLADAFKMMADQMEKSQQAISPSNILETTKLSLRRQAEDSSSPTPKEDAERILKNFSAQKNIQSEQSLNPRLDTAAALQRAELGILQAFLEKNSDAQKSLAAACPTLRDAGILDAPPPQAGEIWNKRISAADCFRELALVKQKIASSTDAAMDDEAFSSAQEATSTEAAAALTQSAARRYLRMRGAGGYLDNLDQHTRSVDLTSKKFVSKWPVDSLERMGDPPSDYGNKLFSYMNDQAILSEAIRSDMVEINKNIGEIRKISPEYFDLRSPRSISLSSLQAQSGLDSKLLNSNEALVVWMTVPGERSGLVFAVSKSKSAWARMGLSGDQIDLRVKKLRNQIDPCSYGQERKNCESPSTSFDRKSSWELYNALLGQPEINKIISSPEIKNLLIVPSGTLTTLPPSILITEKPEGGTEEDSRPIFWSRSKWLVDDKAIAILPAVSTLATLRLTPQRQSSRVSSNTSNQLFMLADPDFSGSGIPQEKCIPGVRATDQPMSGFSGDTASKRAALSHLRRLPCTLLESQELSRVLGGGVVLSGPNAREAMLRNNDFKSRLESADILAFATHGIVAGELGLGEPALALAAPLQEDTEDDGLLTASKISLLKLSADLVILSACNTASPDRPDATGLSGLSRAFFFAGARGVFASHWRVDDQATSTLISRAVELRKQGNSKAQALRMASRELMGRGNPDRNKATHPSLWAPFVLIGEPE